MKFTWDPDKALSNFLKHGVDFEEAANVFYDPLAVKIEDRRHSETEDRFWMIGRSDSDRILLVVFTERIGGLIRIISAHRAGREERKTYENQSE